MNLIYVILILTSGINFITKGEEQQIVKAASYEVRHWSPHYNCTVHNPGHCTWTKDEEPFDLKQYGFSYEGQSNCSIRANVDSAREIQELSCVGHVNYIHTTINAGLSEKVDLSCQSALAYERCAWKRNDENVVIKGRYSYTHDPLTSQDCSIQINSVESEDFASWVCSYISKDAEIIEAYTLNNKASIFLTIKFSSNAISTTTCPIKKSNMKCEQQRIVKTPDYFLFPWSFSYSCDFNQPHHCTWLADNEPLDPTEFGYFYETKDNCSIRSNNGKHDEQLDKLHEHYKDISCVGHVSYNNTSVGAGLSENVELKCRSKSHRPTECAWKRDSANVSISGRYAYLSNPIETDDCSIRISDINMAEFGKWTCTDTQSTQIMAAFTIVLKNSLDNENPIVPGDTTTHSSSTVLIIALSVSTSVLLGFIVGLIWKKQCFHKSSQNQLQISSINVEPTRDNMHPLPISTADEAIPIVNVNETTPHVGLHGYAEVNGEQVRREVEESNGYLHRLPLAQNPAYESPEVTPNESVIPPAPSLPVNIETIRDSVLDPNGYVRMHPVPSRDNRSLRAIITSCANESRLIDL